MKNILCFGDSNTWGYDPSTQTRFPKNIRWTGVLQKLLGSNFNVIEEGLNGRTTNVDEREDHGLGYFRANRSAMDLLSVTIETNSPIDLIIVMLGTNDLKTNFKQSSELIAQNMKSVCELIIKNEYFLSKSIILVAPTQINEKSPNLLDSFIGTKKISQSFSSTYKKISDDLNLQFLDASKYVETNEIDGLHWDENQHANFAKAVFEKINSLTF